MVNMENDDEQILRKYFADNKQPIADDGFSHRVMNSLPRHTSRPYVVWQMVCVAVGLLLFYICNGADRLYMAWCNISANAVSYMVSVDFSALSPIMLLASFCALSFGLICLLKINLDA